jgi:hypothetical protein
MKIIERFPDEVFLALTNQERSAIRQSTRSPSRRRTDRAAKSQAR